MAKKESRSSEAKRSKMEASKAVVPEKTPPKRKSSENITKPAVVQKPKPRGPWVTFARWFNARGFKPHWKAGMAVHAGDLTVRRTPEEWDRLFETY
jgi:hypothetical protein